MKNEEVIDLDDEQLEASHQEEAPNDAAAAAAALDEYVTVNDDGSKALRLEYPIDVKMKRGNEIREDLITSITFRRPQGDDLLAIMNFTNQAEQARQALLRLTGQPPAVIGKIDVADFMRAADVVNSFFPKSRKRGKAS